MGGFCLEWVFRGYDTGFKEQKKLKKHTQIAKQQGFVSRSRVDMQADTARESQAWSEIYWSTLNASFRRLRRRVS